MLALVSKENADLVIVGKQAIDDDAAQTAPMLAALWDRPQATFCSKVEIKGTSAVIVREVDAGLETIEVDLPAVITADLRLNEPRYVKLPDIMKAKKKPLDVIELAALGVSAEPRPQDRCRPSRRRSAEGHHGQGRRRTRRRAEEEGARLMSKILVIAEHDGKKLNPATARCVTCARQVPGAEITVAVFAADPGRGRRSRRPRSPASPRSSPSPRPHNAHALAAVLAPQIVELAAGYSHVFGASTTFGKDLMPRVAALLGVPQISDAMSVEGAYKFKRPIYAGNAIVTRRGARRPQGGGDGAHRLVRGRRRRRLGRDQRRDAERRAPEPHPLRVGSAPPPPTGPTSAAAAKVVSGGRALGSKENFEIIVKLADTMGAAVGASRAAVDAGYAPNELQVGQTGKIIAPELYVAIGISGAIQHLTGIKDAKTIVAINKDGEAPIFEVADFGLVADLFQVVPELQKALGK